MKSSRKSSSRVVPLPGPLFFYEVAEYGTVSDPSVPALKLRAEVFHCVSPAFIHSTDDLVSEVEGCSPLASHFSILAADHLSDIEDELDADDDALGFVERRRLAFLAAALQDDPDTGWRDWVEHEGDAGLANFKEIIQDWLDEDVDWGEAEWFDSGWSGQSAALGFFPIWTPRYLMRWAWRSSRASIPAAATTRLNCATRSPAPTRPPRHWAWRFGFEQRAKALRRTLLRVLSSDSTRRPAYEGTFSPIASGG
ncbi:hypothetical protein [Polaromonas sp. CG_23.6]|nr:hypothetical protein [Polaromonas sp. CG_23.6]MDH6185124.1 hypothetical protein [Polaromonas sp. CG_23.6]